MRVGEIDVGEEQAVMRGEIAGRIDIMVLDERGRFRARQEDRLVVGADHGHHDRLRRDAAGMVVELHRVGDVEMLARREIVEGEIGRREGGVDGAGARAGRLDDVVDVVERHQFGVAERTGQQARGGTGGGYADHGRGMPVLVRSSSVKLSAT